MRGPQGHVPGLGAKVKSLRASAGESLTSAAERTGVERAKLNRIELEYRGRGSGGGVSAPTLIKLGVGYGVSLDWLCGLTSDPRPEWDLVLDASGSAPKKARAPKRPSRRRTPARKA